MSAALRTAFFILIIIFVGSSLAFASDLGSQRTQENVFAIKIMPQEIADYKQDSAAKEDIQPLEPAIIEDIVKDDPKVMVAAPTYIFPFGTDRSDSILDILTTGSKSPIINTDPSNKKKRNSGAKKDNTSQVNEPVTSNPDQPTNPDNTDPGNGNSGGNTDPGNGNGGGNTNPGNGGGSGDGSTTPGNGNGGGNTNPGNGNGNNSTGGNGNSN